MPPEGRVDTGKHVGSPLEFEESSTQKRCLGILYQMEKKSWPPFRKPPPEPPSSEDNHSTTVGELEISNTNKLAGEPSFTCWCCLNQQQNVNSVLDNGFQTALLPPLLVVTLPVS